jgi:hypothetical protein
MRKYSPQNATIQRMAMEFISAWAGRLLSMRAARPI